MKSTRWLFVAVVVASGVALVAPAAGQGKAGHASLHWSDPRGGGTIWTFPFGDRPSGARVSRAFKLSNWSRTKSGKLALKLTGSSAFSIASDKCSRKNLAKNLSCWVGVTYAPGVVGTTDTATLTATGGNGAAVSLSLSGSSCSNTVAPGHIRCWGAGVDAALPANAKPGGASVRSVSCSSTGNCSAVGAYVDSAGHSQGLLLTETGGIWSTGVEATLPPNASATNFPFVSLDSVSCSSAGNCGAVGSYLDDSGYVQGMLLTETAGVWSTGVEAELPANGASVISLSSISCASAGNCSAVGLYQDTPFPWPSSVRYGVLLTETGGSWAPGVELALPAGAALGSLGPVSCGAAGDCSAVGTYSSSYAGSSKGLLVTETGGSWGPGADPPLPADASSGLVAGLSSVSCASAGNCTAVGVYNGSSYAYDCDKYGCSYVLEAEALLLTETAGVWHADSAALPSPAQGVESFASVSCASPGNCSAVGNYIAGPSGSVDEEALALTETDGNWGTGVKIGFANGYGDYPVSVSCASPGNCGAVTYNGNLVVQTDGTWGTGSHPSLPARNTWNRAESVSCTSDGGCTAVGPGQVGQISVPLLIG